jgi:hypothetical protein
MSPIDESALEATSIASRTGENLDGRAAESHPIDQLADMADRCGEPAGADGDAFVGQYKLDLHAKGKLTANDTMDLDRARHQMANGPLAMDQTLDPKKVPADTREKMHDRVREMIDKGGKKIDKARDAGKEKLEKLKPRTGPKKEPETRALLPRG